MDKKIAIVGESTFIVNSLKQSLIQNEFIVSVLEPKMKDVTTMSNEFFRVIVYSEKTSDESFEAMVYLRDFCMEHEIKISVVGYPQEIEELQALFGSDLCDATYVRPFAVNELIADLEKELEKIDYRKSRKHILVVDDSGTMLRTVKGWLDAKYKVSIANSAAMAFSILATTKPDLILLDYEMPICNGPQFLEMIRAELSTQKIPVFFLTAQGNAECVKKVLDLKPEGYLLKTMTGTQVVQKIEDYFYEHEG